MSEPSASDVAAMAAEADRKRRKRPPPQFVPKLRQRLTFTEAGDTATLTIQMGPPFRGREALVGLLTLPMVGAVAGSYSRYGELGAAVAAAACVATGTALVLTAPPLRLLLTRAGDFILYTSNPRRPRWAGRLSDLKIEVMRGAASNTLVTWLRFQPTKKHLRTENLPMIRGNDIDTLKAAAKWASLEIRGLQR